MLINVKKYIKKFLNKSLAPFSNNTKILAEDYVYHILDASRSNAYVENIGDKADSLHRRIEQTYEENIRDAYIDIIFSLRKYMKLNNVILAIDVTDWDFYGKTSNLYLHNWTGKDGIVAKFKYIVLSMVNKEKQHKVPLVALPLHIGYSKAEAIDFLLGIARKLFRKIKIVLFDRGFYSGEVLDLLEKLKLPYILFVPQNKAMKKYLIEVDNFGNKTIKHTIKYYAGNTGYKVIFDLILIKDYYDRNNKLWDWCFATNLALENARLYVFYYMRRWQIETNFRVQKEAKIRSRSVNHLVRYFYFMIRMLLHTIWLLFIRQKYAFQKFLIVFSNTIFLAKFGIDYIGV